MNVITIKQTGLSNIIFPKWEVYINDIFVDVYKLKYTANCVKAALESYDKLSDSLFLNKLSKFTTDIPPCVNPLTTASYNIDDPDFIYNITTEFVHVDKVRISKLEAIYNDVICKYSPPSFYVEYIPSTIPDTWIKLEDDILISDDWKCVKNTVFDDITKYTRQQSILSANKIIRDGGFIKKIKNEKIITVTTHG